MRSYPPVPPVSVAPMMDWTDRHYRYFVRRFTRRTLLYTEMITSSAIVHGDAEYLLSFHPDEHPLALQLGGDDPEELARAVEIAEGFGYDEFNLNVGCPSDRVQRGNFGAVLMATPHVVTEAVRAMRTVTDKPVTVKHRIGIDGRESYDEMRAFVEAVDGAGAQRVTIHARIAILSGLNPKENRNVPPLRYEDVYRIKRELPHLPVEINGGIRSLDAVEHHLQYVDGVMLGRAAYANPYLLAAVDDRFFGDPRPVPNRREVVEAMYDYVEDVRSRGIPPRRVFVHMLGLFAGLPGARYWKRNLSGKLPDVELPESGAAVLKRALDSVPEETQNDGYRPR